MKNLNFYNLIIQSKAFEGLKCKVTDSQACDIAHGIVKEYVKNADLNTLNASDLINKIVVKEQKHFKLTGYQNIIYAENNLVAYIDQTKSPINVTRQQIIDIICDVDNELNAHTEDKIAEMLPTHLKFLIDPVTGETLEQLINECRDLKIIDNSMDYLLKVDFEENK